MEGAAAPSQGVPLPSFEAVEVVTGKPVRLVISAAYCQTTLSLSNSGHVHASFIVSD